MAHEKDPPRKREREKTDVNRHAGRVKADERRPDSDLDSEHQANLNRDAERAEADKAKLQSRRDSDVARERADMGKGRAERQTERDKILRMEREIADEAIRAERLRADAATERERARSHESAKASAELLSHEHHKYKKAKAALTTREEFLAIVSHDLRNPLNNISIAAQNLLEEPEDIKEIASSIRKSAGEMLRLIEDLLDVERIAAGKLTLECEQHDVSEIVKRAVEELEGAAASKGVTLRAELREVNGYVVCDRSRVMQVLSNLIQNAVKFTPANGQVCVSYQRTGPEGKEVRISVSDTGEGIASEKAKTIFERFSQMHDKDRRGLGLGLYIAKMMVEQNRGRIWVESQLGEGSTFHFTLPSFGCM